MSQILTFHIELVHNSPPIWRKVEVPEKLTLGGLHFLIQELFGWESHHQFDFRWNGERYSLPGHGLEHTLTAKDVTIEELIGRSDGPLGYLCDDGDTREVELTVEERSWPEEGVDYPRHVAGERAGPPEALDTQEIDLSSAKSLVVRARDSVRRHHRSQGEMKLSDLATLVTAIKGDFLTVDGKKFTVDETLDTYPTSNELRDCLSRLPVGQLNTVAKQVGIDGWPSLRGDREEAIAEKLLSDKAIDEVLHECSDDVHDLLDELADASKPVNIHSLLVPRAEQLDSDWMLFNSDSGLGELRRHGLVHVGLRREDGTEWILCGIPDEIRERIA